MARASSWRTRSREMPNVRADLLQRGRLRRRDSDARGWRARAGRAPRAPRGSRRAPRSMQLLVADQRLGARPIVGDAVALASPRCRRRRRSSSDMSRRVMRDSIASSSCDVTPSAAASFSRIGLGPVALEPLPLAAQPIEAALLGARRAEAHQRPAATDVLLDVRADPPDRVGRQANAARRDRSDRPRPGDRDCPPGSDRAAALRRCGTRTRS